MAQGWAENGSDFISPISGSGHGGYNTEAEHYVRDNEISRFLAFDFCIISRAS